MDALFNTYNVAFTDGMLRVRGRDGEYGILLDEAAMVIPVTGAATAHSWLEQTPGMKEWVGDRVINNLKGGMLMVKNRNFEETIGVGRNDIEDDQYGMFAPRFTMMGGNAEAIWLDLAIDAVLGNRNWADGNPFFADGRVLNTLGIRPLAGGRYIRLSHRTVKILGFNRTTTILRLGFAGFVEVAHPSPEVYLLNLDSWYSHLQKTQDNPDFWEEGGDNWRTYMFKSGFRTE